MTGDLAGLSALEARDRMARGDLTVRAYVDALITVIEAREPEVKAFTWFDAATVRAQADRLDERHASTGPTGPLHGLPVAIKDVIDTAGIPTENGCRADKGRVPDQDAWIVSALKNAGALVMGKSVTTELAFMHPGPTTNPHNPAHTPGGSSSGSAAAVAAGMVPLAIGTQTGGSVIRPAAFCGVVGVKPTFDALPKAGVLTQSQSLDTLGFFARSIADASLLVDALIDTQPFPPAEQPRFASVQPPFWAERATDETKSALSNLVRALGDRAQKAHLPKEFEKAEPYRRRINHAEMAQNFRRYAATPDLLSARIRAAMEDGDTVTAPDYLAALAAKAALYDAIQPLFERVDAILCPAAPGPAPKGLESTGDSIFNGLWTYLGVPAVTLPFARSKSGLPIGVQLVGRRGEDGALMHTAAWLQAQIIDKATSPWL